MIEEWSGFNKVFWKIYCKFLIQAWIETYMIEDEEHPVHHRMNKKLTTKKMLWMNYFYYSWSLFWCLLITEGAPSRYQWNSVVAFPNHLFGIPTIFEKNFNFGSDLKWKWHDMRNQQVTGDFVLIILLCHIFRFLF